MKDSAGRKRMMAALSKLNPGDPLKVMVERAVAVCHAREQRGEPVTGPTAVPQISMYIHCRQCIDELQAGAPGIMFESPETYSRLSIGWTLRGIQVVCQRHNSNVMHMDFEGVQHVANVDAYDSPHSSTSRH